MDSRRPFAPITLKTMPVHGFDHSPAWGAKVRNVSRPGSHVVYVHDVWPDVGSGAHRKHRHIRGLGLDLWIRRQPFGQSWLLPVALYKRLGATSPPPPAGVAMTTAYPLDELSRVEIMIGGQSRSRLRVPRSTSRCLLATTLAFRDSAILRSSRTRRSRTPTGSSANQLSHLIRFS